MTREIRAAHPAWNQALLPQAPLIDDDAHARIAARGLQFHGYLRAGVGGITLVVDAPAALLERDDAVALVVPLMFARRREPEHPVTQIPGGHFGAEPRFELGPCRIGFECVAVRGFEPELRLRAFSLELQPDAADADRAAD